MAFVKLVGLLNDNREEPDFQFRIHQLKPFGVRSPPGAIHNVRQTC